MYILSRTVSKLLQITGQICTFEAPFGGLGATYDVHLRLIGKLVGDFLLVIIEHFSLGAFVLSQYSRYTGEYRLEVAVFEGGGSLWPNISGGRGRPPPTICARIDRPVR